MSQKYVTWYYYNIWYILRRQTYGIIWYKNNLHITQKITKIYYEINYMINQMSVNVSCIFDFVLYFRCLFYALGSIFDWFKNIVIYIYLLNWKNRLHSFMIFGNNYSKSYGRLQINYFNIPYFRDSEESETLGFLPRLC